MIKFRNQFVGTRLVAIGLAFVAIGALTGQAGERVIFSNSNSKISIPKEELERTITPNSEGFDKDKSSVQGVMAPYQNPLSSRPGLRQKQRLLKALDRQKNWMLQDPDELLRTSDLSAESEFDEEFDDPSNRYGSRSRNSFERYYTKRESYRRFDNRSRSNSRYGGYGDSERDAELNGEKEERVRDSFATPEDFEKSYVSVFDTSTELTPQEANENALNEDLVAASILETQTDGIIGGFTEAAVQPDSQPAASQGVSLEFQTLLNSTISTSSPVAGNPATPGLQGGTVASQFGAQGPAAFGARGAGLPVRTGVRSTISQGISASAVLGDTASGGFGAPSAGPGSGLFDNNPVTPSILNRPAVFELPKRSF